MPEAATFVGVVLTTIDLDPIYTNTAALQILAYPPLLATGTPEIHACLRRILGVDQLTTMRAPAAFTSGRRQYICRALLLDAPLADPQPEMAALLFERWSSEPTPLSSMARRFHLSPRESETVSHLIHGLTTKEVAARMCVSPNTVKQFVRIAMSKLGVTTRSGIVGKVLGA